MGIGIKAVNKGNGKTVGQVSVNDNVVSMKSIDDGGKEFELRVSEQGPQYKEGNEIHNLAIQEEVDEINESVKTLETIVDNEISRSVAEDAKKVNINSPTKLNVSAWKNTDSYVYSVVPKVASNCFNV